MGQDLGGSYDQWLVTLVRFLHVVNLLACGQRILS